MEAGRILEGIALWIKADMLNQERKASLCQRAEGFMGKGVMRKRNCKAQGWSTNLSSDKSSTIWQFIKTQGGVQCHIISNAKIWFISTECIYDNYDWGGRKIMENNLW